MKRTTLHPAARRGVSLVETMVAIGVLAVVSPLAVATLLKSGEGGSAARAETRSALIVESCLTELIAARDTASEYLPKMEAGQPFGSGQVVALAFARDGTLLGSVSPGQYQSGVQDRIAGQDVVYLARLQGEVDDERNGFPLLLRVAITIEHPAVAPAERRRSLPYHTKLP